MSEDSTKLLQLKQYGTGEETNRSIEDNSGGKNKLICKWYYASWLFI